MDSLKRQIQSLKKEVLRLEKENSILKAKQGLNPQTPTVKVPAEITHIFEKAENLVSKYFSTLRFNPSEGTIEIDKERYILVRASALSHEFLNSIIHLYSDRGEAEALHIGKNLLFDLAHVLGLEDAQNFHKKMKLTDSISKLSAGPVHFAYAGWAFVHILPESKPSPDENFFLKYHHPFSFEADSWLAAGKKSTTPVCIMNAGYSSGWCEASFNIPLTAVEISCRAMGHKNCTFIMAPPHKIESYLGKKEAKASVKKIAIPSFLERKKIEEKLHSSIMEKEVLIKEIHHRVKNNLQIISSLLNLQAGDIDDAKAREKYRDSINRIKSMAIIHELLYKSKNLSKIKIEDHVREVVSYIKETYGIEGGIRVRLHIKVQHSYIDIDKAIPCGIIINELLSNAYKHAFTGRKSGIIDVEFKEANGRYILKVSDNGIGSPDFNKTNQPDTLGLQLIYSLVEQIEGKLTTNTSKGTSFIISFS